jgi:type VI secretion system secreted protein VgrG
MLGGAVAPGPDNIGMQLIAAQGAVDLQAQGDTLSVQARDQLDVISANGHIDWAAAKSISLSTAGGANITIAGGNITVQCPGKITIHAGKKSFTGPATMNNAMPTLPRGALAYDEKFQLLDTAGDPIANMRYAIVKESGGRIEGITDAEGNIQLVQGFAAEHLKIEILGKAKQ